MKTVSLNLMQLIATLDPVHQDAYDALQRELMQKAVELIGRDQWDKVFDSDEWDIKASLTFYDQSDYEIEQANLLNELEHNR
jgi:hypothetical protein